MITFTMKMSPDKFLFDIVTFNSVCVRNFVIIEDRNLCLMSCEIWDDLSVIHIQFASSVVNISLKVNILHPLKYICCFIIRLLKTNFSSKEDRNLCSESSTSSWL